MSPMLSTVLLMLTQAASPPAGDDIVVTARPEGCRIDLAEKALTDQEFDAKAKEWAAGRPVRVIAKSNASIACLSKIAFKLNDRGVTQIQFVDPSGKSEGKFRQPNLPVQSSGGGGGGSGGYVEDDIRERERSLFARRIAGMILAGNCGAARRLALENGDLDAAAKATTVCSAPMPGK
ncbi:hypothetical protein [Sphingomonas immobilis]|uniref:Uncharacterized protein n=1 Tax=Sphingomonas immobilis TaxID=3063997 RepID=A0ABT8ZTQ7_9SPHN|nr:hypothetical protein [Sphingomonas sp. CA1-15]MDO7840945.1 hypothetical protein [Sphingomonas sp. CA1-15]